MKKQYRKPRNRGLRNLRSTTNNILDSTDNTTMKGVKKNRQMAGNRPYRCHTAQQPNGVGAAYDLLS